MGPCRHGIARSVVADGGDRPQDVEGSREYTEQAIAGSLQGVVLQLCGWAGAHNSSPQRIACCEMLHLVGPCEHGNELSGSIEGGEFLTS